MNKKTYSRRLKQLLLDVNNHHKRTELLNIMQQQLLDDTVIVDTD